MILSVIPIGATVPADRMLLFVGIGAMGLLAQFFNGVFGRCKWRPQMFLWRIPAVSLGALFVLIHLVISPLALMIGAATIMLRIFPLLLRIIEKITARGPGLAAVLAIWQKILPEIVPLFVQLKEDTDPYDVSEAVRFRDTDYVYKYTHTNKYVLFYDFFWGDDK